MRRRRSTRRRSRRSLRPARPRPGPRPRGRRRTSATAPRATCRAPRTRRGRRRCSRRPTGRRARWLGGRGAGRRAVRQRVRGSGRGTRRARPRRSGPRRARRGCSPRRDVSAHHGDGAGPEGGDRPADGRPDERRQATGARPRRAGRRAGAEGVHEPAVALGRARMGVRAAEDDPRGVEPARLDGGPPQVQPAAVQVGVDEDDPLAAGVLERHGRDQHPLGVVGRWLRVGAAQGAPSRRGSRLAGGDVDPSQPDAASVHGALPSPPATRPPPDVPTLPRLSSGAISRSPPGGIPRRVCATVGEPVRHQGGTA